MGNSQAGRQSSLGHLSLLQRLYIIITPYSDVRGIIYMRVQIWPPTHIKVAIFMLTWPDYNLVQSILILVFNIHKLSSWRWPYRSSITLCSIWSRAIGTGHSATAGLKYTYTHINIYIAYINVDACKCNFIYIFFVNVIAYQLASRRTYWRNGVLFVNI